MRVSLDSSSSLARRRRLIWSMYAKARPRCATPPSSPPAAPASCNSRRSACSVAEAVSRARCRRASRTRSIVTFAWAAAASATRSASRPDADAAARMTCSSSDRPATSARTAASASWLAASCCDRLFASEWRASSASAACTRCLSCWFSASAAAWVTDACACASRAAYSAWRSWFCRAAHCDRASASAASLPAASDSAADRAALAADVGSWNSSPPRAAASWASVSLSLPPSSLTRASATSRPARSLCTSLRRPAVLRVAWRVWHKSRGVRLPRVLNGHRVRHAAQDAPAPDCPGGSAAPGCVFEPRRCPGCTSPPPTGRRAAAAGPRAGSVPR